MKHAKLHPVLLTLAVAFFAVGCAQEAEDKVAEAGQDLEAAWEAEKEAVVEQMNATMDTISEDIDAVKDRARQLEQEGEAAAAQAWNETAERLESARDAAARDLQALENAGADAWEGARDTARASMNSLDQAWDREKAAIAESLRNTVDAASEDIEAMKARVVELEEQGAEKAAAAWQRTIERMEAARDAAASEVAALEEAGADAWHDAAHAASDAVGEVEELGSRAAAFAAEAKDDFIAGARSVVEKSEQELARAREALANAEEGAKEKWQAVVDDLEANYENAMAEAQKVEEAGADAWGDLRHGFVEAWHDLADATERAAAEFDDD